MPVEGDGNGVATRERRRRDHLHTYGTRRRRPHGDRTYEQTLLVKARRAVHGFRAYIGEALSDVKR